jgi:uncharacterized protein YfiM (DUF2279 family)
MLLAVVGVGLSFCAFLAGDGRSAWAAGQSAGAPNTQTRAQDTGSLPPGKEAGLAGVSTELATEIAQKTRRKSNPTQVALRTAVLVGVPLAVTIYGQQIWEWGRDPWRFGSEGFFGRDTEHGGADKVGHAFAHYVLFRSAHAVFSYTESGHAARARLFAGLMAGSIGLGIEIGDGFNGKYGFSWEDLTADLAGIGLGLVLETYPALDDLIGLSATYVPTRGFWDDPHKKWLAFEGDTSGWTYLFNFKLAGAHHLGWKPPRAVEMMSLDMGYYTRGFTRWDMDVGNSSRVRSLFLGISINLSEVVDSVFQHSNSRANRALRELFRYYHVPLGLKTSFALD